jgi:putative endonuclease
MKKGYVYIMSNKTNTVLYTGVTSNIRSRINEHKDEITGGFTKKYNIKKLVYLEEFETIQEAIDREKQLKGGSRKKKEDLIKTINPDYKDLSSELF